MARADALSRMLQFAVVAIAVMGASGVIAQRHMAPREVDEARAMMRENFQASYWKPVVTIDVAARCKVVDNLPAGVAIQHLQLDMRNDVLRAGLANDLASGQMFDLAAYVKSASLKGKEVVANGGCERLSAADRGRVRAMVASLAG